MVEPSLETASPWEEQGGGINSSLRDVLSLELVQPESWESARAGVVGMASRTARGGGHKQRLGREQARVSHGTCFLGVIDKYCPPHRLQVPEVQIPSQVKDVPEGQLEKWPDRQVGS